MQPSGCLCDSRSVETRRRYGWSRTVFPGARLFQDPIWCPSGGGGTREARSTFAESLVALYLVVRTKFGAGGGQFDRRGDRGVLNPCARESKARTGRFLSEKLISDHGLFSSYEGQQEAENGNIFWRRLHQLKASTMDPGISFFSLFM